MQIKEHRLIMGLLALAVFSQAFLFSVSYTQASWTNSPRQLPDPFALNLISPAINTDVSQISDTLAWSVQTATQSVVQQVQPVVSSFLSGSAVPGSTQLMLNKQAVVPVGSVLQGEPGS